MTPRARLAFLFLPLLSLGTAQAQQYPVGWGPNPTLPEPERSLIPTINVAEADP